MGGLHVGACGHAAKRVSREAEDKACEHTHSVDSKKARRSVLRCSVGCRPNRSRKRCSLVADISIGEIIGLRILTPVVYVP